MFKAVSIAHYMHCCQDLVQDSDLLHLIHVGVYLPLKSVPSEFECTNYHVLPVHNRFIKVDIANLLVLGKSNNVLRNLNVSPL